MAENIKRSKSQSSNFDYSKGGVTAEFGPFIGIVKSNIDPTRSGRLQIYIEDFGGDPDEPENWRTVSYASPFYGITPHTGPHDNIGKWDENRNSYGFWANPPDLGVRVLCVFAAGDPNFGYYIACIPELGANHMIPAIAATENFDTTSDSAKAIKGNPVRLPVAEFNTKNIKITEQPLPYNELKPVHGPHAASIVKQGLITDTTRGTISSSSQRESPSRVIGISTPGRPLYNDTSLNETNVKDELQSDAVTPKQAEIIGRKSGHTFVMDDGDIDGTDQLIRIRTSAGHQIMMNDQDETVHIINANGTAWVELGKEGTIDVYGTNSINMRTQGHLNLQADKDINIQAGEHINIKGKKSVKVESDESIQLLSEKDYILYSKMTIKSLSDGTIQQQSKGTTKTTSGGNMYVTGGPNVYLNSGGSAQVKKPDNITKRFLPEILFSEQEWKVADSVETILTRMTTHEPFPFHNSGVNVKVSLNK